MSVDLPLDKKLWKIRTEPPGRGPLGLLGAGPWAVGLLLAKPECNGCFIKNVAKNEIKINHMYAYQMRRPLYNGSEPIMVKPMTNDSQIALSRNNNQ